MYTVVLPPLLRTQYEWVVIPEVPKKQTHNTNLMSSSLNFRLNRLYSTIFTAMAAALSP